jgi:amidophosphoribosyltransferase
VFDEEDIERLRGHAAIGHNRYSTSGSKQSGYVQPIVTGHNSIALAHNGNLPSVTALRDFLRKRDITVPDEMDSVMIAEALGALIDEGKDVERAVEEIYPLLTGAFSLLLLTKEKLVAVRDRFGLRPLSLGTVDGGYAFSSETCGLATIGAGDARDVAPGSMVVVDKEGMREKQLTKGEQRLDIFEFVYFSRPDSSLLGKSVYEVRKQFGVELAKECSVRADVVVPVPETAIPFALGFSEATGIPFELGLTKNRYIHRTFIEPGQKLRERGVRMKLSVLGGTVKGKRVVVADDSIVRGTTSRQIVKMLIQAGAREVHFVVSSPPVRFPDFYGIDTPEQRDLLAHGRTIEEMREYLGATSLCFLSLSGMIRATGLSQSSFSTSCFSGEYPIDLLERRSEVQFNEGSR